MVDLSFMCTAVSHQSRNGGSDLRSPQDLRFFLALLCQPQGTALNNIVQDGGISYSKQHVGERDKEGCKKICSCCLSKIPGSCYVRFPLLYYWPKLGHMVSLSAERLGNIWAVICPAKTFITVDEGEKRYWGDSYQDRRTSMTPAVVDIMDWLTQYPFSFLSRTLWLECHTF